MKTDVAASKFLLQHFPKYSTITRIKYLVCLKNYFSYLWGGVKIIFVYSYSSIYSQKHEWDLFINRMYQSFLHCNKSIKYIPTSPGTQDNSCDF